MVKVIKSMRSKTANCKTSIDTTLMKEIGSISIFEAVEVLTSPGKSAVDIWEVSAGSAETKLKTAKPKNSFLYIVLKNITVQTASQRGSMNLVADVSSTRAVIGKNQTTLFSLILIKQIGTNAKSPASKESVQLIIIQRKTVGEVLRIITRISPISCTLNFFAKIWTDINIASNANAGTASIPGIPNMATKGTLSSG